VPEDKPDKVYDKPLPAMAPGLITQLPAGKPDNTLVPVATEQVGCVVAPNVGAAGVTGCALIIMLADTGEVQPEAFVTVYAYVPVTRPDSVLLVPVPAMDPGFIVQLPAGRLFSVTLPVASAQVGCIMAPTVGAVGVEGCALITILTDADEEHPTELVTV